MMILSYNLFEQLWAAPAAPQGTNTLPATESDEQLFDEQPPDDFAALLAASHFTPLPLPVVAPAPQPAPVAPGVLAASEESAAQTPRLASSTSSPQFTWPQTTLERIQQESMDSQMSVPPALASGLHGHQDPPATADGTGPDTQTEIATSSISLIAPTAQSHSGARSARKISESEAAEARVLEAPTRALKTPAKGAAPTPSSVIESPLPPQRMILDGKLAQSAPTIGVAAPPLLPAFAVSPMDAADRLPPPPSARLAVIAPSVAQQTPASPAQGETYNDVLTGAAEGADVEREKFRADFAMFEFNNQPKQNVRDALTTSRGGQTPAGASFIADALSDIFNRAPVELRGARPALPSVFAQGTTTAGKAETNAGSELAARDDASIERADYSLTPHLEAANSSPARANFVETTRRQIIEQVVSPLIAQAESLREKGATRTLRIRLQPEELGGVEINLKLDERGHLSARLSVEREAAHRALTGDLAQLHESLRGAAIDVEKLEVALGGFGSATADLSRHQQPDENSSAPFVTANAETAAGEESESSTDTENKRLLSLRA